MDDCFSELCVHFVVTLNLINFCCFDITVLNGLKSLD